MFVAYVVTLYLIGNHSVAKTTAVNKTKIKESAVDVLLYGSPGVCVICL